MSAFLASVSVLGWVLIALLAVGLWALPGHIKRWAGARDPRDTLPERSDGRPDTPPPLPFDGGSGET